MYSITSQYEEQKAGLHKRNDVVFALLHHSVRVCFILSSQIIQRFSALVKPGLVVQDFHGVV